MQRENLFGIAEHEVKACGACPVTLLDGFFTNYTAFDELCAEFTYKACVVTNEDMGFSGEPWMPIALPSVG